VAAHTLYTFDQTREELRSHTAGLDALVWTPLAPVPTLGFQLRHIAGSVGRLTSYLEGLPLTEGQLADLRNEAEPGPTLTELLQTLEHRLATTASIVRLIPPSIYPHSRAVGRAGLPTTVGGLMIHLSEHTQRHLGQAILTAKLLKNSKF
jgi:hypothetical protein